jgi:hypothetical protein
MTETKRAQPSVPGKHSMGYCCDGGDQGEKHSKTCRYAKSVDCDPGITKKPCSEMTNNELAEFIEQGAWRENSGGSDESAYQEAAKRLRGQTGSNAPAPESGLTDEQQKFLARIRNTRDLYMLSVEDADILLGILQEMTR